jgi:trehalose/maltose hydrolase-like predicted phosphorylase
LNLVISDDGILAQFDGYFELEELDWERYRAEHGDIHRMDRILKAEGKSPDAFKVAKQADALMIFYTLTPGVVGALMRELGFEPRRDLVAANLKYYLARTSHGSTLSRVVHSHLAWLLGDEELGWRLYREALVSDFQDIQGGSTAEGIHTGVMAGTVMGTLRSFAGLALEGETVSLAPRLPSTWRRMAFGFRFRGARYELELERDLIRARAWASDGRDRGLRVAGTLYGLSRDDWVEIELRWRSNRFVTSRP